MSPLFVTSTFTTPVGLLRVEHDEHAIYSCVFTQDAGYITDHPLSRVIDSELTAYFDNPQHRFQITLKPQGSAYQQKVWNELLVIPVGRTLSYGELAHKVQSSPRAIGQACKRNPIALFIPCHRVVGKNDLGGFMGNLKALAYKSALLQHESKV